MPKLTAEQTKQLKARLPAARRFALSLLRNESRADDAMQEALLDVLADPGPYLAADDGEDYLLRIVKKKAQGDWKAKRERQADDDDEPSVEATQDEAALRTVARDEPTEHGCFSEFSFAYREGNRTRVLSFVVDGSSAAVRAFYGAANVVHAFVGGKAERKRDFRVLLAWVANEAGAFLDVPEVARVRPISGLPNTPEAIAEQWAVESPAGRLTLAELARRWSYPGGAAALGRLVSRFERFGKGYTLPPPDERPIRQVKQKQENP